MLAIASSAPLCFPRHARAFLQRVLAVDVARVPMYFVVVSSCLAHGHGKCCALQCMREPTIRRVRATAQQAQLQ
eukprot:2053770-Alexandrium_andersonii.AAC.1